MYMLFWFSFLIFFETAYADFNPPGLESSAVGYFNAIRTKAPPQVTKIQRDLALKQAKEAFAKKDFSKATTAFELAMSLGVNDFSSWLSLSESWGASTVANRERALYSAFIAYRAATQPGDKIAALWRLVTLFDESLDRPEQALQAAREIQSLGSAEGGALVASRAPGLESKIDSIRRRVGLTLQSIEIKSDDTIPRACLQFSDPLSRRKGVQFADFIRLEPTISISAEATDQTLCLVGLQHGSHYQVTIRQGLPGEGGLNVRKDETKTILVPDRTPSVAFRGSGFLLPRLGADGVPVTSVNLEQVSLKIYRLNDRNLASGLRNGHFSQSVDDGRAGDLTDDTGEMIWQGKMAVKAGERNREITTAIPWREIVPTPKPGMYVITAEVPDLPSEFRPDERATQWVLVSDLALTSFRGADGVTVFARSFATAKPMPGVEVVLLARNNSELGKATTDAQGRARFPAGLTRGTGGNAAMAVTGYAGTDFSVLDLTNASFDLSDRGVGGRTPPGALDAFVYTDRGVYRQGETVHLSVLLRDDQTRSVESFPLTVKVTRPNKTEYQSGLLPAGPSGGFFLPISLSKSAPLGGWHALVFADPKADPIGQVGFQVDDFVPERLSLELTPAAALLELGKPFEVLAKGRFLYGPPAAGLTGTAELSLQADPQPYAKYPKFHFGLAQEEVTQKVETLEFPTTDASGLAHVAVKLPALPDTTQPLRGEFRFTLNEPGGRPTRASVTVPVRTQSYAIGICPKFEGEHIGEGKGAVFEVIALTPEGKTLAKPDLSWELFEERTTYQWFLQSGKYNYRGTTKNFPRKSGMLSIVGESPATLTVDGLEFGRYRLEVVDKKTRVASSFRFSSGWQSDATSDTPDKLEISTDKAMYSPGETARVRLTPPFAGEVLLTVATDRLFDIRTFSVSESGSTVEIPVDLAWGPGAYVTATVYRPPVKGRERQPVRAIGVSWLGIDPAGRTLSVALNAPEVARPRQKVTIDLRLTPSGENTFATLAAVDEGILQLTRFTSPDPGKYLFGKRLLGLDIRDDYGHLIDAIEGPFGALRSGGDASGAALPVVPFTVVSLFSGPIQVGNDGMARVPLEIPDFNGQLRLMAVAYSHLRVGSASSKLIIRDPLIADAILPRFLAPGDNGRITLNLHNVEASANRYQVSVRGVDTVSIENGDFGVDLASGERKGFSLPLYGTSSGIGKVVLSLSESGGKPLLEHVYPITVRPARPVETQFLLQQVSPGGKVRLNAELLSEYLPGTGRLSTTFSSAPPFDVPGILQSLDRYPNGCLEQVVSRALPLLVTRDLETALGNQTGVPLEGRIQQGIAKVLDKQRYDGAFSIWGANGEETPWVTAYALEFLTRAKEKGYPVPEKPFQDGLDWLRRHAIEGGQEPADFASRAYAFYVLSLAGVSMPSPTRYFHDTFLEKLPTPLAKGQIGAALARLGDEERAGTAFSAATVELSRDYWGVDYGTTVRDSAALLTLLTESHYTKGKLVTLIDHLPASATSPRVTNTQEQAWLVLAANALMQGAKPLALSLPNDLSTKKGDPIILTPSVARLGAGIEIGNAGTAPIWQATSISGVPREARPAVREGLRIRRNFFSRTGQPISLDQMKQNDVFVLLLEGETTDKLEHQTSVTHPLPAGWEIEKAVLSGGEGTDFAWLTDLTTPESVEGRDDRYVAAVNLSKDTLGFKLAFLVRAVTPGDYELPGARIEDMYRSNFFAQQAAGHIVVRPAGE
ncbi:alpha-2-macroglobulin [Gammaproteobacteria bacterium]